MHWLCPNWRFYNAKEWISCTGSHFFIRTYLECFREILYMSIYLNCKYSGLLVFQPQKNAQCWNRYPKAWYYHKLAQLHVWFFYVLSTNMDLFPSLSYLINFKNRYTHTHSQNGSLYTSRTYFQNKKENWAACNSRRLLSTVASNKRRVYMASQLWKATSSSSLVALLQWAWNLTSIACFLPWLIELMP